MNANAPSIIPASWTLPESLRERIGQDAGPQRAMVEHGHLLLILHQIPAPSDHKRRPALFWRKPDGEWLNSLDASGISPLTAMMADYEQRLYTLDNMEDNANTALEYHDVLEALSPLLRASRGLHRATQQARDLIKSDRTLIILRDKAADLERTAELLLQDAKFGLNFTAAKQAEAQAKAAQCMSATAHRLNILAALFFPLTALASVFGMQLHHGWENSDHAFWIVLASGIAAGVAVSAVIVKKN